MDPSHNCKEEESVFVPSWKPLKFRLNQREPPETSRVNMKSEESMGSPIKFTSVNSSADAPAFSCVSMKRDLSMESDKPMDPPPNITSGDPSDDVSLNQRESPESSCVSIKSDDESMSPPLKISSGDPSDDVSLDQRESPESSFVSMKTDDPSESMSPPLKISAGDASDDVSLNWRTSPEPSCVSMKSEESMGRPLKFSSVGSFFDLSLNQRTSPEPSCVSIKSEESICRPLNSLVDSSDDLRYEQDVPEYSIEKKQLDSIFKELEHDMNSHMKKELERFKKVLSPDYRAWSEKEEEEDEEDGPSKFKEGVLNKTLHILRNMKKTDLASMLLTKLISVYQLNLKSRLKEQFQRINEGMSNKGNFILLNEIYTELYITEGGTGDVNKEHEVRQLETQTRRPVTQETPIKCNDIFKALPGQDNPIKTVLTTGVAGIGKTVSVQKFILDWAEGKANQDTQLMLPLSFRELNLMKDKNISLMDLLKHFFTEMKEMKTLDYQDFKIIFIFDGLDECRLPLDFSNNLILSNVTESASVDVLLTNLIKGNLLPSAHLWITSRPAAASQIPSEYVDQVTEVRGFSDPQKDEYFRKRINNPSLANRIITHIKSTRSLHIMCHIPVFCWISSTVLERMLGEAESAEIPKTLTQMFTHFLIFQIKLNTQKYDGKCDVDLQLAKKSIMSLGKLAFQQLERGNLIFYESDLRECGIDVTKLSMYSGVCTQIFREEFCLYLGKVYSFVHLSIQEFLAALFRFLSFIQDKEHNSTMSEFLKSEVDKALKSENGHLDLFLRFLLGLSLESNQSLLQGLLTQTESSSHSGQDVIEHIKMKIRENPSPEKSINLFRCLNELNDHSLVQEVQSYLSSTGASHLIGVSLSPAQWSALVFVLLNSEDELDEFKLNKYDPTEECLLRLLPVVKASIKADLSDCNLTEKSCSGLASALSSNPSSLRELNLSYNNLLDSGGKLLSAGLENPRCKLETLKISHCSIEEKGCTAMALALKSNSTHLKELDLSYNKPGQSGVMHLSALLKMPQCKLEKLRLINCSLNKKDCIALASALTSDPSHLKELNLSLNKPGNSGGKLLSALLNDPHCKLEKLELSDCDIVEKGCAVLASALKSNPSHLRKLDLSKNKPGNSGVKQLSELMENPHCKLESIWLSDCSITEKGCRALVSALRISPSRLTELNLSKNNLGDSGVKLLSSLLEDPLCKLKKLWLSDCKITEKGCTALASALRSNPSHLRELDLSNNKPGNSGVKMLSDLLEDTHCKLETLWLSKCNIGKEDCASLASALKSNPSHLRELNLNSNRPGDSGVVLLSALLEDPHCKLEKLCLPDCNITKESCAALASALRSNPSHLKELNLTGNKLGYTGGKLLSALIEDPHCKLEKLELCNCSITEDSCAALASALKSNSSHMRELNLSKNDLGDSGVKLLSDLLEDVHCKLERLWLSGCNIKKESSATLVSALKSKSSRLRELDLTNNKLNRSDVKLLTDLLEDSHYKLEKIDI
ncbi:NACHT, LRR and PYD domains-containing protein 12-like isoform X2 [Myxocyprinus asiaticus]|uniref:NACHT, LRR and PYD domains-containing protein 12-like isoform X2 n=1 Tax=Myxocyprinus asiaticus TaxID=70543 RepID=UPI002222E87E|nr:NACHT, LRR and PYD domains-containing protein 12-like isoform X2 [Myxocyprinus asiaticus]